MKEHALLADVTLPQHANAATIGDHPAGAIIATDDPALIREWADRHNAEPATGEATPSGPATVDVHDNGAGIRFSFPAASRFRPISWEEWFANLHQHELLFVYERDAPGTTSSGRYRLVPRARVQGA